MIGFTSIGFLTNMDLSHRDVQHYLLSERIHPEEYVSITEGYEIRLYDFNPPKNIRENFGNTGKFEDFVHEYTNYLLSAGKFSVLAIMMKKYLGRKQDIIFYSTDEELQLGYLDALAAVIKHRYGIYVLNPNELLQFHTKPPSMPEYKMSEQGKILFEQDLNNENQLTKQEHINVKSDNSGENQAMVYPHIPNLTYEQLGQLYRFRYANQMIPASPFNSFNN